MRETGQLQALRLTLGAKLRELCRVDIEENSRHFNKNTESVRIQLVTKTASLTHGSSSSASAFMRQTDFGPKC